MEKRLLIFIKGDNVQRCGFRNTAVKKAAKLGLSGSAAYVGHDLVIEVEGPVEEVDTFTRWAERGPDECFIALILEKEIPLQRTTGFVSIPGVVSLLQEA